MRTLSKVMLDVKASGSGKGNDVDRDLWLLLVQAGALTLLSIGKENAPGVIRSLLVSLMKLAILTDIQPNYGPGTKNGFHCPPLRDVPFTAEPMYLERLRTAYTASQLAARISAGDTQNVIDELFWCLHKVVAAELPGTNLLVLINRWKD